MTPLASRLRAWTALFALAILLPGTLRAQDTTHARDTTVRAPDTLARQDSMARSIQRLVPVVTVSRDVGRSVLDLPYAITAVRPDSQRPGQQHLAADQTLFGLPGVVVATRTNPSQDVRIAVRGFGSRSSFGVRS
ncbi:MAG TPA: hypothetical protein VIM15_05480, partial [Gemmatimonadaceae bacterium]